MKNIRSCLDFISSLVERTFCADLHSRNVANSGLFARTERVKMAKRTSNKPKSSFINLLTVKSKQLLIPYLLLLPLFALASCKSGVDEASMSPQEELEHAVQLHSNKDYDNAMRSYSRVVLHPDATDEQCTEAFKHMARIENSVRKNYRQAIRYVNQAIVSASLEDKALLYAHKGDYSKQYNVWDSAVYYCNKALQTPHENINVDYVAHYVLWQVYKEQGFADSASRHKELYYGVRVNDAYGPTSIDDLEKDLYRNITNMEADNECSLVGILLIIFMTIIIVLILLWYFNKKKGSRNNNQPIEESIVEVKNTIFAEMLQRSVHTFEATPMYEELSNLRIKEKELYKNTFTKSEQLEDCLFSSFKEITYLLSKEYNLSSSELLTLYCTYMGFSPNVIGYITHTTAGSVRKRNDRLKIKLLPEHADIFFGRGEKTE